MNLYGAATVTTLVTCLTLDAQPSSNQRVGLAAPVALVGVTILPMDSERELPDQTIDIYVAYYVDGPVGPPGRTLVSVADARSAARSAKAAGFDFIKAYNSIPESAFVALVEEARAQAIAVTGHGVRSVGLQRGFAIGQVMVAHGEEYL